MSLLNGTSTKGYTVYFLNAVIYTSRITLRLENNVLKRSLQSSDPKIVPFPLTVNSRERSIYISFMFFPFIC